jgi:hypothetical protein
MRDKTSAVVSDYRNAIIGLIFRNLSKSMNDFFGASSHKIALERKD